MTSRFFMGGQVSASVIYNSLQRKIKEEIEDEEDKSESFDSWWEQ